MPEPLTFGTVITLALGSSVVGSAVTQTLTSYREGRSDRREAAYLALRLATILEKFAEDATTAISEADNYESSGGTAGELAAVVPTLGDLPDKSERWREIPVSLTARVLGFEPYRRTVQAGINSCFEMVGPGEGYAEARRQCVRLGRRAVDLAQDLRSKYGLPALEMEWDWVSFLRRTTE